MSLTVRRNPEPLEVTLDTCPSPLGGRATAELLVGERREGGGGGRFVAAGDDLRDHRHPPLFATSYGQLVQITVF